MSGRLLHETIGYRPMGIQEFSPRRRTFWALSTSIMAGNALNEPPVVPRTRGVHPAVREIHKNAWLKRQVSADKKGTPFSKKGEKFWVVFCVHDDVEALLEFYSEPKMGTIHKPLSAISLNSCLHVSPSIIGQDNEYQFAVTLPTEVIRLVAANWDQMIEWVESLQGKLREMNILSPKDNLYSKLPETKLGTVASTRDPNSPLPPTPSSLAAAASSANQRVLNQNVRSEQLHRNTETSNSSRDTSSRVEEVTINNPLVCVSVNGNTSNNTPVAPTERDDSRNNQSADTHYDTVFGTPHQPVSSSGESSHSQENSSIQAKRKPKISVRVNVDINNVHRSASGNIIQSQQRRQVNGSTSSGSASSTTLVVIGNGDVRIHNGSTDSRPNGVGGTSTSVTIRCSSSLNNSVEHGGNSSSQIVHQQQMNDQNSDENRQDGNNQNPLSQTRSSNEMNESGSRALVVHENGFQAQHPKSNSRSQGQTTTSSAPNENTMQQGIENELASNRVAPKSTSSENIYERIYLPERETNMDSSRNVGKHGNGNCKTRSHVDRRNGAHRSSSEMSPEEDQDNSSSDPVLELHARRMISNGGSSQRSASVGRIEHPSTSTRPEQKQDPRRNDNKNGQVIATGPVRSIGNSTFFYENESAVSSSQLQGHPIDALIGTRVGEYRLRRNDNSIGGGSQDVPDDNQSNDITSLQSNNTSTSTNLPLKEQQVIHLQMEINHPGGVRITLRKKDCINSIAFVDYLGAVWVAGWKQTQYPVLYYAFHVGDQILKVAGVTVQSSLEAIRAIKMVSSMQVEFIIRRLPYGRVFALKRSRDGEPLGLVAEGGSGEISEVLPEGLAARYGLPPKGLSLDGQTPCNWYLTEVNNRPLSLMSKENEVKDRLNAVGKEISILVQPADLVKHLRKNLKSYKGFKDYVVG